MALLVPLKRSPEYRAIRGRVVIHRPVDSWQEEGFHFFVFQLLAGDGVRPAPADAPVAVFAMHPESTTPVSAIVVTPTVSGEQAEIVDVRHPETVYTAPLSA